MKTARLRVRLRDVEPAVVRVIDVPAATTLPELHELLQAALGWTDSHLHQFVTADVAYGQPDDDAWPPDQRDEGDARLADLGEGFTYLYDFGDGWTHDVTVLGRGGAEPGCVDGNGSCPPEDCGGPDGYAELLEALADPTHDDHEHLRAWVGNRLRPFDRAATEQRVREAVGAVPGSVRLLLGLVGDGVKLTATGRLPRVLVREIQQQRPHWSASSRPASTEDDLWPLAELHTLLRRTGLLRLRHGVLTVTRAAGDDRAVVRRLRAAFDPDAFSTQLTELTVGVLAAHGPMPLAQLSEQVYPLLGHAWRRGGQPLTVHDVRSEILRASALLAGLDLADDSNDDAWTVGASARSLLPGAALLADVWGNDG